MNRLFAMLRYSKALKIILICAIIDLCFILGISIFDIVQLLLVQNNPAKLSTLFVPLNIALVVLSGLSICLIIAGIVLIKCREKRNEQEKN